MKTPPLSPEEYYRSLARKIVSAGVLFRNHVGEFLIVKPNYKEGWLIPGGNVDEHESPHAGALREVREEIGLEIGSARLLCVDYNQHSDGREVIHFIFWGGELGMDTVAAIKLQEEELDEHRFVSIEEAERLLRPGLRNRFPLCLEALEADSVYYLENGVCVF